MAIQEIENGLIVSVTVKPKSPAIRFYRSGDDIILELTCPAREGQANQEIVKELPRLLRCEVSIIRGAKTKKKLLMLKGITEQEFEGVLHPG